MSSSSLLSLDAPCQVLQHPLVGSQLARVRDAATPPHQFRDALHQLATHLVLEATRTWPQTELTVTTPLVSTTQQVLSPTLPIWLLPILRAGLAFEGPALTLLPQAQVYHLGLARCHQTFQPKVYYDNLPPQAPAHTKALVLDPMLATGGSALAALQRLVTAGVTPANITLLCVLASPQGVHTIAKALPNVTLLCAALDETLNANNYIVPGLGDAGDRYFNT
jgi:uracil phosphoribosyltransferase